MNLNDLKKYFTKATKESLQEVLEKENKKLKSSFIDEALGTFIQAGKDNEIGGILTTLNNATSMLSNPAIAEFFNSPSKTDVNIDIYDYLTGNLDVYLVCPVGELKQYPQILDLFINLFTIGVKIISPKDKQDRYLFILDEIGQLAYLPSIETVDSIGREDGFRQHLYFQTMDQIDKYKDKNMLKNFEIQRYFKTSEPSSIRHIHYLANGRLFFQMEHLAISPHNSPY
jgi:type IV secretory pathway TraG/TraD family ATPase VirD4